MEKQLTQEQLGNVVAEVTRLAQQREETERETLDREQVALVLKELNLPVELLDDAMEQLRRREALEEERKKKRRLTIFAVAFFLILIALGSIWYWTRSATFDRITAGAANVARTTEVARDGQEAVYRVTLNDAPLGEKLTLNCNWYDPSGNLFSQNSYTTREVDKAVWPTSCKCQIGANAPKGTWKVEMKLGDRVLSSTTFEVE